MWQKNAEPAQNAEFRQCFKCNYEAVSGRTVCPRCRSAKFLTSKNIRTRGIVLVVIGLFLSLFIGGIAVFVAMLLFGSKDPETIRKVNKDIVTFLAIYLLFGAVIVFGIHSIISGIWMIAAGKRSRVLLWLMWALLASLAVLGTAASVMVSK
jgi:phosphate starvation-inducible membrane PsiE